MRLLVRAVLTYTTQVITVMWQGIYTRWYMFLPLELLGCIAMIFTIWGTQCPKYTGVFFSTHRNQPTPPFFWTIRETKYTVKQYTAHSKNSNVKKNWSVQRVWQKSGRSELTSFVIFILCQTKVCKLVSYVVGKKLCHTFLWKMVFKKM